MALPHFVVLHLDISEVGVITSCSWAWRRAVSSNLRSALLRQQFGPEEGAWLTRCSLQKQKEALRYLVAVGLPKVRSCQTDFGDLEHESHTIVALPQVAWPGKLALDNNVLGVMVAFGGIHGRAFEPLATSWLVTLSGSLRESNLKATCQEIQLESVPPARFSHTAMWLQDLTAMVVYGGRRSADDRPDAALGDLWLLERLTVSEEGGWHWREVAPASSSPAPGPRCHFASCELSGRSFFVHGGHNCNSRDGLLDDAWVCWIDDGFDELDGFGDFDELPSRMSSLVAPSEPSRWTASVPGSRQGSPTPSRQVSPVMSRQVMDQLTRQVSDSYKRIAPQVSISEAGGSLALGPLPPAFNDDMVVGVWSRVEADGTPPPRCCGHAAARCRDGVIIHGVWSGASMSHCLGPVHVLEGLSNPKTSTGRRPHYSRLSLDSLRTCRPQATLHAVAGHPVLVGGWGENNLPDSTKRAWHASCKLPMNEAFGPLIVVFGGRDFQGNTCTDLLVLHWVA